MLNEIHSSYIKKIVLSYINDNTRYHLIKYNKNIQNILDITIMNYRILSGKYILGDPNGKGKEYNSFSDALIFEGEFIKGKRKAGKEYNENNILIFDGEYLNGKRKSGKEYNKNNILIFDGEYLNGKRKSGKEYNEKNILIYEGEYLNGKRNGKGKEFEDDFGKLIFKGEFLDGKRNGKGEEYNEYTNLIFEG